MRLSFYNWLIIELSILSILIDLQIDYQQINLYTNLIDELIVYK